MALHFKDHITRSVVRANPEAIFVFGDNLERRGLGGQAAEMRGEPNTIGVATKVRPDHRPGAYLDDSNPMHMVTVMADLEKIRLALNDGKDVVFPIDGIGTGRAQLTVRAPAIAALIEWFVDEMKAEFPPRYMTGSQARRG